MNNYDFVYVYVSAINDSMHYYYIPTIIYKNFYDKAFRCEAPVSQINFDLNFGQISIDSINNKIKFMYRGYEYHQVEAVIGVKY